MSVLSSDYSAAFSDKVKINDLYLEAVIGFYHWEHSEPQPLLLDIALGTDFDQAFESDNLEHTLDYAAISKGIKQLCQGSRFHLLEGLAKAILQYIFAHWPVKDVHLSMRKPHALRSAVASIECYRTRVQMEKLSMSGE